MSIVQDRGGAWNIVVAQVPKDKRDALAIFETHVRRASDKNARRSTLMDDDLRRDGPSISHSPLSGNRDRRLDGGDLSHLLGRRVFGGDHAGEAPLATLLGLSRKFIRTGAPAERAGLLRALRNEGHVDVSAPAYDRDIEALRSYSDAQRIRLQKHTRLALDGGIPIPRDCLDPLLMAIQRGAC